MDKTFKDLAAARTRKIDNGDGDRFGLRARINTLKAQIARQRAP